MVNCREVMSVFWEREYRAGLCSAASLERGSDSIYEL